MGCTYPHDTMELVSIGFQHLFIQNQPIKNSKKVKLKGSVGEKLKGV